MKDILNLKTEEYKQLLNSITLQGFDIKTLQQMEEDTRRLWELEQKVNSHMWEN
ncbi:MAG: hypothetical protein PVG39_00655 [Desulfobacteraceae bacterium]|jgi:hypothetical protein